jgi:hypothetical protein
MDQNCITKYQYEPSNSQDNSLKKVKGEAIKEVIEEAIKICKEECEILNPPSYLRLF